LTVMAAAVPVTSLVVPTSLKGLTVSALQKQLNELLGENNQQYKVPAALLLFVAYTSWRYKSPFGVLKFLRSRALRFLLAVKGSDIKNPLNKAIYGAIGLLTKFPASTFEYEDSLPKLPVPTIAESMNKFLASVKPLLSSEEYAAAELKTQLFEARDAPWLQRLLQMKAWNPSCPNWIDDWWLDVVYLMGRESLLSTNIAAYSKHFISDAYNNGLERAALLMHNFFKIKEWIDTETLRPKVVGGVPISMEMYRKVFGATRLPGKEKDSVYFLGSSAQHLAFWYGTRFYRVEVRAQGGRRLSVQEIYAKLLRIKDLEETKGPYHKLARDVTGLTALPRTEWWEVREHMVENSQNKATLDMIESAAFCVCVDKDKDLKVDDADTTRHTARTFLMKEDNAPSWMDKSFTLYVDKHGCGGLMFEHGVADATVYGDVFELATKFEHSQNEDFSKVVPVKAEDLTAEERKTYEFDIDSVVEKGINSAVDLIKKFSVTRDVRRYKFGRYGKDIPKKFKMSPDAYFQMALQAAYYMTTKSFSLTYESASTRLFRHGRTETIRSCTKESVKFVEALLDPSYDAKERARRLKAAVQVQTNNMRSACFGEGYDRHILALRILGHYVKADVPLFNDKSIKMEFMLSTSQTPGNQILRPRDLKKYPEEERSFFVAGGGFMAVADDGFGVCYSIQETDISMNISKRLPLIAEGKADPVKDTDEFANNLEKSLFLMKASLEAAANVSA